MNDKRTAAQEMRRALWKVKPSHTGFTCKLRAVSVSHKGQAKRSPAPPEWSCSDLRQPPPQIPKRKSLPPS